MSMRNTHLAIFDFDGTIADSFAWFSEKMRVYATRFGFRLVTEAEADALRYKTHSEILEILGIPFWKVPRIANAMRNDMKQDLSTIKIFPFIDKVLLACVERQISLAIVSSNAEINVRTILRSHNIDIFDYYACGISLNGKAAKLTKIIDVLQTDREQTIYIGDEVRDISAARISGIRVGSVAWGYNRKERLRCENPDFLYDQPSEILTSLCIKSYCF